MTVTLTGVIGRGRDVLALTGWAGSESPGSLESTPATTMPSKSVPAVAGVAPPRAVTHRQRIVEFARRNALAG
jgi:hypothetical protein